MKLHRIVFMSLLALQVLPALAAEPDLDRWLDRELIPYVNDRLLAHPRFRGETIMFVVLDDNTPAPISNELTISLRDRLLDSAIDTDGVRIGWRQGNTAAGGQTPVDCTRDDVHYYIGLELSQQIDNSYLVSVRALDLEDRNWVTGFGKSWNGGLSRTQLRALQQPRIDETFLGSRDVPFAATQTDLLARHLAHKLSCSLLRQSNGQYIVPATTTADASVELGGTVELIGNNIAAHSAIELTADDQLANAALSGKAHRIDGSLYEYWLTVTPTVDASELTTLSASAYVSLPDSALAADAETPLLREPPVQEAPLPRPEMLRATISIPNAGTDALIGPLSIATPASAVECDAENGIVQKATYWSRGQQCSLLRASTRADVIVFFIEHHPQLGLVRLGGSDCRERTTVRLVRRGEALRFPIAYSRDDNRESHRAVDWLISPPIDTYYAVAVTDDRAARRLANHIDRLPIRCGASSRHGLTGRELRAWLDEFAMFAANAAEHIDWRAIAIRDVL